jgi:hypothetical protein
MKWRLTMKFDMHCHTKEGSLDGRVPIEQYIFLLQQRGFDGMLITDHNSYKGYRAWKDTVKGKKYKDFVVLKGIEYDTIDAGHILVILPEDVKLKIMEFRGLPVQFLIDIVHQNGGILGPAHPCGEKYLSITHTGKRKNQLAVMDRFDFLEGFNACEDSESNSNAMQIAKEHHLPVFGGSDAHRADCVGLGSTEFAGRITCESDLINLIKEEKEEVSVCGGEYYHGTTKQKIGKINNILIMSFWFYNRMGSIYRRHKRRIELKKLHELS